MSSRRPLAPLAIGFAVGSVLPGGAPALATFAALALALSPPLAPLAFTCAGWAVASSARAASGRPLAEEVLQGRVVSVPERFADRVRFTLLAEDGRRILATAKPATWPLALGDRVRFRARLRAPEGQRNPGGRDRAAELAARGIQVEAYALSSPVRTAPPSPLAALEHGRDRFSQEASRKLTPRQAGLVRAIASGDRSGVDPETADAFARSGLAHLLSVSGLHLAVVALGAYRCLRWLMSRCDALATRVDPRRAAALVALPATAVYAVATGADVPVVRSALAASVGFGALLLDREVDGVNVVALAAIAVLAVEPGALRDPSFQLSFASVAGLGLWTAPLRRAMRVPRDTTTWFGRAREAVLSGACASTAATLATAPIVALHFRRLGVVAVASNLVGVPVGSALTVVGTLAAALCAASTAAAGPLFVVCAPLASLLLWLNDAFASPSWATVGVGSPGAWGVAGWFTGCAAAWRGRRAVRAAGVLVAIASLFGPPAARRALAQRRGGLEIVFLSVGQGDATILVLPDGAAVLVDAGGEARGHYDPGARDVVPWLRDAGVRRLAAVFVSHPHPDHVLGLPAVAAAFPIERVFTNGRAADEPAAQAAMARLPAAERLRRGERWERAGVRFEALGPPEGSEAWTENDASLVLKVTHGTVSFLLCGDIEAEGEAALTASEGAQAALRADVVKVPHHGSATSSGPALVSATGARFAVMTVGRENRFGFPSAQVVERWTAQGTSVLRTDSGAARFLSDGSAVRRTPAGTSLDALALAAERL